MTGNLLMNIVLHHILATQLPGEQLGLLCLYRLLSLIALQTECFGGPGSHCDCDCRWVDSNSRSCRHLWNEPGTASSTRL